jgi:cytochrome oxidase Cu insertion factor (SCO1/SenC/PrrC family)
MRKIRWNKKAVFGLLLIFSPALFLILISTRSCQHKFKRLDDFGTLTQYSFTDAKGKSHTAKEFEGELVIITCIQNSCPSDCGISLWKMDQLIYQHIRKNNTKKMKHVRILSFVTDGYGNPVKDISTIQEALKDRVEGYDPNTWMVASGDARKIYDITHNGQNLLQKGDKYYGGEAFQSLVLLADKENHLRMVLPGNQEGLIRRMKESIALLQKQYDKDRAAKN